MEKSFLIKKASLIILLTMGLAGTEALLFLLQHFLFLKYEDQIGFFKFIPTLLGFALFFKIFDIIVESTRLKKEDKE